jgi:hypothetical protein
MKGWGAFRILEPCRYRLRLRLAGWQLPNNPLPLLALQWLIRYFEQLAAFISRGGMLFGELQQIKCGKVSSLQLLSIRVLTFLSWILISDISSFAPQLPSFVAGSFPEFEMLQKINGVILGYLPVPGNVIGKLIVCARLIRRTCR